MTDLWIEVALQQKGRLDCACSLSLLSSPSDLSLGFWYGSVTNLNAPYSFCPDNTQSFCAFYNFFGSCFFFFFYMLF